MVTLELIEAVRGSRLAAASYQFKIRQAGDGAALGDTAFAPNAIGLPDDGQLQPKPDKDSAGCPLEQGAAGRALP